MEARQLTLSGVNGPGGSNPVVARVNPTNNLPMTTAYSYSDVGSAPEALKAIITTVSSENMNLREAQKGPLAQQAWSYKLQAHPAIDEIWNLGA